MKFLCLHGAYGSASVCNCPPFRDVVGVHAHHCWQNFQVQLGPFAAKTSESGQISFKWISGRHEAIPPPGCGEYFGRGPLYRFIPFDGIQAREDILNKLSEFPQGATPEDTMRQLCQHRDMVEYDAEGIRAAILDVLKVVRDDPEIEVCRSNCRNWK